MTDYGAWQVDAGSAVSIARYWVRCDAVAQDTEYEIWASADPAFGSHTVVASGTIATGVGDESMWITPTAPYRYWRFVPTDSPDALVVRFARFYMPEFAFPTVDLLAGDTDVYYGAGVFAPTGGPAGVPPGGGGGGGTGARYPVQESVASHNNQSSAAVTMTATPTDGNVIIAVVASEGATNATSIVQTNVTWTKIAESTASTSPHVEIWKGVVAAAAGTGVTVTWSGSAFCSFYLMEWASLAGTLDQSAVLTNQTNQYIPTITPTSASALVISGGSQTTYAAGFDNFSGPDLVTASKALSPTAMAVAFGFPGTSPVIGAWPNGHGGNFSGATVSLT
jgi:hypothetical protein